MENLHKILTKDIIFFDLETTGVDIKVDEVIELYAIKFTPSGERIVMHQFMKPSVPISDGAFNAHGISLDSLKDYPTMREVVQEVYDFFKGCDLGGFNCLKFDIPFLFEEFTKYGLLLPINVSIVDSYNLVNKMEPRTLSDIYNGYFGETFTNAHSAKHDTEATVAVFLKQVEKYGFIENVISEISSIVRSSKDGDRIIDLSGWFIKIGDEYYYNRGMHKDTLVYDNIDYLRWMIGSNKVENNTRIIAKKLYEMHVQ